MHAKLHSAVVEFGTELTAGIAEVLDVFNHSLTAATVSASDLIFAIPTTALAFDSANATLQRLAKVVVLCAALPDSEAAIQPWRRKFLNETTLDVRRNFAKLRIEYASVCMEVAAVPNSVVDADAAVVINERVARVARMTRTLWESCADALGAASMPLVAAAPGSRHAQTERLKEMSMLAKSMIAALEGPALQPWSAELFVTSSTLMRVFDEIGPASTTAPAPSKSARIGDMFLVDIALQEAACAAVRAAADPPAGHQPLGAALAALVDAIGAVLAGIRVSRVADARRLLAQTTLHAGPALRAPRPPQQPLVRETALNLCACDSDDRLPVLPSVEYKMDGAVMDIETVTVHDLIVLVSTPSSKVQELRKIVVQTYSSFTTPVALINRLVERYKTVSSSGMDDRVSRIRHCVLVVVAGVVEGDKRLRHDRAVKALLSEFSNLCREYDGDSLALKRFQEVLGITRRMTRPRIIVGERSDSLAALSNSRSPAADSADCWNVENASEKPGAVLICTAAEAIAEQLAMIDFEIYCNISPAELLNFDGRDGRDNLNFDAFRQRFNFVVGLVTTAVIDNDSPRLRAAMVSHFVRVAECSYEILSLSAALAIVSALTSTAIHRLHATWAHVAADTWSRLQTLSTTFSPRANFARLRDVVRKAQATRKACIPHLGVFSRDVAALREGGGVVVEADAGGAARVVSVGRLRRLASVVEMALGFQRGGARAWEREGEGEGEGEGEVDAGRLRTVLTVAKGLYVTQSRQYAASLAVESRGRGWPETDRPTEGLPMG
ncbi:hypothetical protein HDU82_001860 [Entophlyctis luteolus]|nr:hypothetical protein HDU82_001860 [Entophlyctis luteolus]